MTDSRNFSGKFFDGKSGAAHSVDVEIGARGITITARTGTIEWSYDHITLNSKANASGGDIRLGNKRDTDAVLILPQEAYNALHSAAPDIFSGARARRQLAGLIFALILGTGIISAGLFWGVPVASGPLAQATPKELETRIGQNIAAQISTILKQCGNQEDYDLITPVIDEMAIKGNVGFPISFRFVKASAPNAFALPGGQIMATSGLLDAVGDDQEAFLAVMAHELGHVRARDSMQSVYRNAGFGVALEVITGGSGAAQQAVLIGGQLGQLRYTRIQETTADVTATEILMASDLDPAALGRAFEAIVASFGEDQDRKTIFNVDGESIPTWMRSHPDTKERIAAAHNKARKNPNASLPLSNEAWEQLRQTCLTDDNT